MRKLADVAQDGRQRWSRHWAGVLAAVIGLAGLAACTAGGVVSPASSAATGRAGGSAASSGTRGQLLPEYRPSQVTG
jgi:hypothetical protein